MKRWTINLEDSVFEETEDILRKNGIPRIRYINEALDFYNRYHKRKKLAKAFAKASQPVRDSSMEVNEEFALLIDEGEG